MLNAKQIKTGIFGAIFAVLGVLLCLFAGDIVRPKEYSYSGSKENTIWVIKKGISRQMNILIKYHSLQFYNSILSKHIWEDNSNIEYDISKGFIVKDGDIANNPCSYAEVSNMHEDFNINIEDYEIIIEIRAPFTFKYDEKLGRYILYIRFYVTRT